MLGASHRLLGVLTWTSYATFVEPQSVTQLALGAVVTLATSAGPGSPDLDQSKPIVVLGDALGPLGRLVSHRRGLSHWWVLPALAWWWWLPRLDASMSWTVAALLIGWSSHVVGDAVFGRVPITPGWGPMVGLGLDTGGWIEQGWKRFRVSPLRTLLVLAIGWCLWAGVTLKV